jgi:hypothetical protein
MIFLRSRQIVVEHEVHAGCSALQIKNAVFRNAHPTRVFIEDYRSRGNVYNTDAKMREAVSKLRAAMPNATVLDNTGVKQVVHRELMELVGCWKFSTPTHHQDLRSAARIALYGMLKDQELNRLLSDVVKAHLDGEPWKVVTQ